jgi:AraC family transcriptional regulator, arabinose operon regulatory protein
MTNIHFCGYSYHNHRSFTQHELEFPVYLFRLQTEGNCKVGVNRLKIDIGPGTLLIIKPGDEYELLIEESQKSGDYHLACEGPWIDEWWSRSVKNQVAQIDLDDKLVYLWRQIILENRRPFTSEKEELVEYLIRALCLSLQRAMNETPPTSPQSNAAFRMMRYIEEHATRSFRVEDVARHANLSVSRAVHLFKSTFGKTMIEYALDIRLSAAIDRMKYTSMTLEQIAVDCGFGAYPYFHKVFKKRYGTSPGTYRRKE